MAVANLVATVGGTTSNTYATQAEGDQFDDNRPASSGNDWSGASSDVKDEALLWSCILLDSLFVWTGAVVDYDQVLLWPRQAMYYRSGEGVLTTVVPTELKNAQCEFARLLIAEDRMADLAAETKGLKSLKAGPVALEWRENARSVPVPDAVALLIPGDWYSEIRGRHSPTRELMRA